MKIKLLPASIILLFLFRLAYAQDTLKHKSHIHKYISDSAAKVHKPLAVIMPKYPRNGYVAVIGGMGLPLGAFASNEGAGTGTNFSISAAFPGTISHCGVAFKFDYGTNGFNTSRLEGIENNKAGFSNIRCTFPNGLGNCSYSSFLTGIYLTYPKKHITIDFRFLGGIMFARLPQININYYDETRDYSEINYQSASSATAFAIDLGFEVRYPVKPRFCIILSADYLHASPSFTMVNTGATLSSYGSIQDNTTGQETTVSQPFNLFNLSVGVGYTISAKKR